MKFYICLPQSFVNILLLDCHFLALILELGCFLELAHLQLGKKFVFLAQLSFLLLQILQ